MFGLTYTQKLATEKEKQSGKLGFFRVKKRNVFFYCSQHISIKDIFTTQNKLQLLKCVSVCVRGT